MTNDDQKKVDLTENSDFSPNSTIADRPELLQTVQANVAKVDGGQSSNALASTSAVKVPPTNVNKIDEDSNENKDKNRKIKKNKKKSKELKELQAENKKLKGRIRELENDNQVRQELLKISEEEKAKVVKRNEDLQDKVLSKMEEFGKNLLIFQLSVTDNCETLQFVHIISTGKRKINPFRTVSQTPLDIGFKNKNDDTVSRNTLFI